MPSTRGMGSKMICRCAAASSGTSASSTSRPKVIGVERLESRKRFGKLAVWPASQGFDLGAVGLISKLLDSLLDLLALDLQSKRGRVPFFDLSHLLGSSMDAVIRYPEI